MASASSPSDAQGWQTDKSLSQCLLYMFENQVDCDVTFRIVSKDESVHSVPAHRFMLKARSPEFEDMFRHSCPEEINICDIEPEPFKEMMRYIYSEEVNFTGENVMHISYAAKKYKMEGLQKKCQMYIEKELSYENVCGILSSAVLYEVADLVKRCLMLTAQNIKDVLKTDGFLKMSQDALLKLLESNYIPIGFETELYLACVKWAKRQIEPAFTDDAIRAALGPCLYQIRFHEISHEQFAEVVCKSQIVSAEERSAFLCAPITTDVIHKDTLSKLGFNMMTRVHSVNRLSFEYRTSFTIPTNTNKAEIYEIRATKTMYLVGLSTCSGPSGASHVVNVTLTDATNSKELVKETCEVKSDGTGNYHRVYVPKTKLEPNVQYRVSVLMVGSENVGYCTRLCSMSVGNHTINHKVVQWPHIENKNSLIPVKFSYNPELFFVSKF